MKKIKFSLYPFVMPLLVGLAAFSSKERFPDYQLTHLIYWSLLIVFGVIFVQNFKHRQLALLLFSAVVIVRLLILPFPNISSLKYMSIFLYAIIVIFSGTCLILKKPILLLRQMYWLSIISIIMSLLQINGVLWAQEIASALDWKVPSTTPFLFQMYSPDLWGGSTQTRPDGFTHANNLTSQLLLFFYAYSFFFFSFKSDFPKPPAKYHFFIAFACALTAGKVIILGILAINAIAWLFLRKNNERLLFRTLVVTLTAYLLYFMLFPGLFILNFNSDLFIFNAMGRIINLSDIYGFSILQPFVDFLSGLSSNQYIDIHAQNALLMGTASEEAFSGIAFMAEYLPIIIPSVIIVGLLWVIRLRRLDNLYIPNMRYCTYVMLVALISSVFGGPFVNTIWFSFFLSFVLVPFILPYLPRQLRKSIRRECC